MQDRPAIRLRCPVSLVPVGNLFFRPLVKFMAVKFDCDLWLWNSFIVGINRNGLRTELHNEVEAVSLSTA